ncbi:uncharacterized protein [Montipora capricornis]|uniref:uncharacterized protein n=1 Tax=Montipora capricornis TaxID=246305 RepID=UPI0035F1F84D
MSCIVVANVYHPRTECGASDAEMLSFLYESMSSIEARFPSCGILIAGDFNRLDTSGFQNAFQLKQIVKFPTRGNRTLDPIFTNMKSFYKDPINRPAFGLSDHITVELHPLERCEHPNGNQRVMSRDLRETKKIAVSQYLREVDNLSLVQDKDLCEEKTQVLEMVIISVLDGIMPFKSKKVASNEPPWVNVSLKTLIRRRQQALVSGNMIDYNIFRNKVNRARKNSRAKFYEAKEVKNLSGFEPPARADPLVDFQHVVGEQGEPPKDSRFLANLINSSFLSPMSVFEPLRARPSEHSNAAPVEPRPRLITEYSVLQKLRTLNPNKASGPDQIPSWLLKDNADILAAPGADILNPSFQESRLPKSWKRADITPLPKQSLVLDVNRHLRPVSLTPILSKVAEDYVVEEYIKPAVLVKVDWNQFGTVPNSSTAHALISMLHTWYQKTDGNSSTVRVVLFDFKKAFDLIDNRILLEKLKNFDMPEWVRLWIEDFLTDRHQRVKLSQDCFSEWGRVPAGVPQGTKLGPWLFVVMINDLHVEGVDLWKYVDDTTISETTHKSDCSQIQTAVDNLVGAAQADRFKQNEAKCKELQICFARSKRSFPPVVINNKNIEVVKSAKLLGLFISDDLKWNAHVAEIVKKEKGHPVPGIQTGGSPPAAQDPHAPRVPLVRALLTSQGLSASAASVILQGWRAGTQKQYASHLKRWELYCGERKIDPLSASVIQGVNFLSELYQKHQLSYSVLNKARSALSPIIFPSGGENVRRTKPLRSSSRLFISYQKPHASVTTDTAGRWLRKVLENSGLDVSKYGAHSTRAASTSAAKTVNISIRSIMDAAGWSNAETFRKFYDKPMDTEAGSFGTELLHAIDA